MKKKKGKLASTVGQIVSVLIYLLTGALCGGLFLHWEALPDSFVLIMALLLGGVYLAMAVQIAIHEAGHLVFGLLTGYRFSSYRFFSLMWIKQGGKLRFKKLNLAGTGGQCLMAPPDWREDFPYVLYNLGGVLMNLIAAALFWLLALIAAPTVKLFLLMGALIGLAFALLNGLPLRVGPIDNDGRNILSISRSPAARRAFWLQMKVNERQAAGVRLRDMPEDWFSVPGDETPENSILAAVSVNRAARLMDDHRFDEAAALQDRLIEQEDLAGIYRGLLRCDRIFCEMLGEGREDVLASLLTKEQTKFMKSMKSYPSVLRTLLALDLLHEHDAVAAEKLKAAFEKMARSYPYPTDIESERELIALAEEKAAPERVQ